MRTTTTLEDLLAPTLEAGVRWSVVVGERAHEPDLLLPTASVGKVFLLAELSARLDAGTLDEHQPVDRRRVEPVADSGLWQHLATDVLPLVDAARLVGTVSDNWATNALLDVVGLDAVRERARLLAPGGSVLHDLVRDHRGPEHPPTLSEGCARDWVSIVPALDERVHGWLSSGVDLSMVASAWGLDPLAHREDPDVRLVNKTGTAEGVRADVGVVELGGRRTAYAALAGWDPARRGLRGPVLAAMRGIGGLVTLG
jgi:beta-lactamase class A